MLDLLLSTFKQIAAQFVSGGFQEK